MNAICIDFFQFDQKLIRLLSSSSLPTGLASGKIGYCLYFYRLSRLLNRKEYKSVAEKVLLSLSVDIKRGEPLDIPNGLSGIGLGITYLIKEGYITGDINSVLRDIDDLIFARLGYPQKSRELLPSLLIQLLIYLNIRLADQKTGSEQEFLFRELIIQTINILYDQINLSFFEEPVSFSADYPLPLFLYVLGQTYRHKFYNHRIDRILEEISSKVLSIVPFLHSSRLHLLWGMYSLYQVVQPKDWIRHITILVNTLDTNRILAEELRNRSIFFKDGLTGIYLLAHNTASCFHAPRVSTFKQAIREKIICSDAWKMMEKDSYFNRKNGLFNGYCGVSLLLHLTTIPK